LPSSVFEVSKLIVGTKYYHLAAFLLELFNVPVAQLGTPLKPCCVIAFDVVEGPMGMQPTHVLAKFVNVAFRDHARLRTYFLVIRLSVLRK